VNQKLQLKVKIMMEVYVCINRKLIVEKTYLAKDRGGSLQKDGEPQPCS
jgi:hypothetical protein